MKKFLFSILLFPALLQSQTGNIDFEQGNYQYWGNALYSNYFTDFCDSTSSPNPMSASGFYFTAMNVTSDMHGMCNGGYDPSVTMANLNCVCPWGNIVSARLNDVDDNCSAARMSYGLSVGPQNSDVAVSYAIVLFDNHQAVHAPKFIYTLKSSSGFLIDSAYFDSNTISTDTAFHPAAGSTPGLYYKGWTKTCYDLTAYIGQPVVFEFVASDCDIGDHRGYAYLDFNLNSCLGSVGMEASANYLESNLKLFPNPASDKLNLTFKNLENDEFEITLMSPQGAVLNTDKFSATPGQINKTFKTEGLTKGLYFLNIRSSKQGIIQRKLIID